MSRRRKSYRGQFVYLVEPSTGLYKIGHTQNLAKRMIQLAMVCPIPLQLLAFVDCAPLPRERFEGAVHEMFADRRSHGEWFALTEKDVRICQFEMMLAPNPRNPESTDGKLASKRRLY